MTNKPKNNIGDLRKQIDIIDDKIIDLLKERLDVVKEVGKIKHSQGGKFSFIRSGREAEMLRNLTAKMFLMELLIKLFK